MSSSSSAGAPVLSFRQRLTWGAHLFKALFYQYHREFAERMPAEALAASKVAAE